MTTQLMRPQSGQRLNISIGRIPFSIHIPPGDLQRHAERRYREFASCLPDSIPILLRANSRKRTGPGQFSYALDDASLVLDSSGADFHGVRHEYALDSLLRILLTVVLLPRRGFLLHAASIVRDGRAYIFMGRSGAGKSTVASLSPAGSVLTDEISLLRFSEGSWQAYGTPFWGEFRAAGTNSHYPVTGIYVLSQATHDRIEPLSSKEILRALLPCVLFFTSQKRAHELLLVMLLNLIEQVPCYRLHFRRCADFWRLIA